MKKTEIKQLFVNAGIVTLLCTIFTCFTFVTGNAQVTIGSNDAPEKFSLLEVVSSTGNSGGIRLPHLTTQERTDLNLNLLTEPQKTKAKGLTIFNVTKDVIEYWDGINWVEAKTVAPWMLSGSSNVATLNTQNIYQSGQVTIGSAAAADPSAMLNITSTDKGLLIPRVTLKSKTDKQSINGQNPTKSLLVYNTGTDPNFPMEAFMFWNGVEWRLLPDTEAVLPEITALYCSDVTLTPSTYQSGTPYKGFLEVSYEGGNGASYNGTDWLTQADYPAMQMNGLEIRLQAGQLALGSGKIIFEVRGTPTVSSPNTTQLPVKFIDKNQTWECSASVGIANARTETRTYLGAMRLTADGYGAEFPVTTMDGRYSLRFYCRKYINNRFGNDNYLEQLPNTDIQIRHNIAGKENDSDGLIIMHQYTYSQYITDEGTFRENPNWAASGASAAGISHNNFRVYGSGTTDTSATEVGVSQVNEGWHFHVVNGWRKHGDPAVYAEGKPEYRVLIFTPTDPNVKRVYRYTFFFGVPDGSTRWDNYASTKCWIFAEEIISE